MILVDQFDGGGELDEGGEIFDGGLDDSRPDPEALERYRARPDEEEEAAAVGLAEPEPLGGPFGSGASPMSLSSRAVLCLSGWLGILLTS